MTGSPTGRTALPQRPPWTPVAVRVVQATPGQWQRVRRLRLAALEESPDSFGTLLEHARALADETWQARAADPGRTTLLAVAVDENGRTQDVGMALVAPSRHPSAAGLYGMWVAPHARRLGVAALLLQEALHQAASRGFPTMVLDVCDHNEAAIQLYAAAGFEPTGRRGAFPAPRSHITEHERARATSRTHESARKWRTRTKAR